MIRAGAGARRRSLQPRHRLPFQAAIVLSGRALGLLTSVMVPVLLSQVASIGVVADYLVAVAWAAIWGTLALIGTHQLVLSSFAQDGFSGGGPPPRHILYSSFAIATVSCVVSGVLLLGVASQIDILRAIIPGGEDGTGLITLPLLALVVALQRTTAEAYRGLSRPAAHLALGGVGPNLIILGALLAIWSFEGSVTFTVAMVVTITAIGIAIVSGLRPLLVCPSDSPQWESSVGPTAHRSTLRSSLRRSTPLAVDASLTMLVRNLDVIIAGALFPVPQAAGYAMAARLLPAFQAPLLVLNTTLARLLADPHSRQDQQTSNRIGRTVLISTAMTTIPIVFILLVPNIPSLPIYGLARTPALVLAIGALLTVSLGPGHLALLVNGHGDTLARLAVPFSLLALPTYLTAALIGTPTILAAAAAAVVTGWALANAVLAARHTTLRPWLALSPRT